MDKIQRLGKNIRALRKAHGESQEKLGYAVGVEKNTISYYENEKREPPNDIIKKIAKYYMISVEELFYSDLSGLDKINVNPYIFWENIDVAFPIIYTEKAFRNKYFKNAFDIHNKVFNQLKKLNLDNVYRLVDSLNEYFKAYNDNDLKIEAAGNIIGILYFFSLINQTPKFLKNKSSVLLKISENNKELKDALEEANFDDGDFEELLNDEEISETVNDLLFTIKRNSNFSDLADYYIALRYVFSLVDNDLEMEINKRIGLEILNSFALVKNSYALNYLGLIYNQLE